MEDGGELDFGLGHHRGHGGLPERMPPEQGTGGRGFWDIKGRTF